VTLPRRKQIEATVIAALGTPIVEALGGTFRWRERGAEVFDAVRRSGRQPILALWHGRILSATLYFRDRGIVAMTSENFDGEWVAQLMRRFGYAAARGSTSRGGARALVQLRRELDRGRPVAFTVDGPRGPARVVQPGAAWLAGATGHPVVPFHIEASKYWTVRSWDRHQVPKPGSDVAIAIGPAIEVSGSDEPSVTAGQQAIAIALDRLEREATALLA
jgi:lysophospholipid acyltransferase (LPLAT)-like uncharacterized protein